MKIPNVSKSTAFTLGAHAQMKGASVLCWLWPASWVLVRELNNGPIPRIGAAMTISGPRASLKQAKARHIPHPAGRKVKMNPVTGALTPRDQSVQFWRAELSLSGTLLVLNQNTTL